MLKSGSIYRRFHFNGHTSGILILIVPFEKTAEKISFEWLCLKFSSTLPACVIDSESEIKMLRFLLVKFQKFANVNCSCPITGSFEKIRSPRRYCFICVPRFYVC